MNTKHGFHLSGRRLLYQDQALLADCPNREKMRRRRRSVVGSERWSDRGSHTIEWEKKKPNGPGEGDEGQGAGGGRDALGNLASSV